jgi:hypothetical protein
MTEPTSGPAPAPTPADVPAQFSEDSVGSPSARNERAWSPLLGIAALLVYGLLGLTAAMSWSIAFLVVVVVSQPVDTLVTTDGYVRAVLARGQFGIATRSMAREFATAVLVLSEPWAPLTHRRVAAICVLSIAALRLVSLLVLVPVRRRITTVMTRNIDLSGLRVPPHPHRLLLATATERAHLVSSVGLVGAAIGMVTRSPAVFFTLVGVALAFELAVAVYLVALFIRGSRGLNGDKLRVAIQARVATLRPTVMLYHSGDPESMYQVNMWLSTVDALPHSAVIVLRENNTLPLLGKTSTPVLCIQQPVDFMMFALPDIRVAMYTANVGKTIHMLREPGVRHVFIGHGDSDKSASSNPFSKAYSEIWVAGEAGRDRYRRANIGIHEDEIIDVGRPQLSNIAKATGRPSGEITVLYAPTWEGWTNDPAHTSVVQAGLPLVQRLLSLPDVRLMYKPHPLTGTVTTAAANADRRIREAVERAAVGGRGPRHEVVVGPQRGLYDCFNECDVLVADVSSVLSDFIESRKPYVVPNLSGLDDEEFRTTFPSTSAAYLLDPGAERIGSILEQIRADDPLADARDELKYYLLGPDEPDALTRFTAAVTTAAERAVALWPERPMLSMTDV